MTPRQRELVVVATVRLLEVSLCLAIALLLAAVILWAAGCAAPQRPVVYCPIPKPPRENMQCRTNEDETCCSEVVGEIHGGILIVRTQCQVIRDDKCPTEWEER